MSTHAQPRTVSRPTKLQPGEPPSEGKEGDPGVDPKKGMADQGVEAYGNFADEKTESSH